MPLCLFTCVMAVLVFLSGADGDPQDRTALGRLSLQMISEGTEPSSNFLDRVVDDGVKERAMNEIEDVSLENTYWRLDRLNGAAFPKDAAFQEPHLMFQAENQNNYSAMLGCNRIRGVFELDGDELKFGPGAATLMACPPPLDVLEQEFGTVLSEVVSYIIEGDLLVLKDAADVPRAVFTAVSL